MTHSKRPRTEGIVGSSVVTPGVVAGPDAQNSSVLPRYLRIGREGWTANDIVRRFREQWMDRAQANSYCFWKPDQENQQARLWREPGIRPTAENYQEWCIYCSQHGIAQNFYTYKRWHCEIFERQIDRVSDNNDKIRSVSTSNPDLSKFSRTQASIEANS